jgi:hypothetical protein
VAGAGHGAAAGEPAAAAFAALSAVDVASLSADEALAAAEQARVLAGFALAVEAEATVRLSETYPYVPAAASDADRRRAAVGELQAAYGWSEVAVNQRLVLAERLVELPGTLAALRTGAIDVPRALMMADRVSILTDIMQRRAVEQVVLAAQHATASGLTTRQWSVLLGRTISAIDPEAAEKRQQRTRSDREVRFHRPAAAGDAAALVLSGPAESAAAADAAVDALARAWRGAGREGTLAQLRYDAAIALLTGVGAVGGEPHPDAPAQSANETPDGQDDSGADGAGGGRTEGPDPGGGAVGDRSVDGEEPGARVASHDSPVAAAVTADRPGTSTEAETGSRNWQITLNLSMPLSTLLGFDDGPGELDRAGVIPASVARRLAGHADVWRRILTDPVDGHVVTQTVRTYRPTKAMREFVLARANGVCAHRGCGHRTNLQLDHIDPWPDGPTSANNLGPFDQRHHEYKTSGGWQHALDPATGAVRQTTPLGREYSTAPLPPPGVPLPLTECPACGWRMGTDLPADTLLADADRFDPAEFDEPFDAAKLDELFDQVEPDEQFDPADFDALRTALEAETDHELIAQINAAELAWLNGDP